MRNSSDVEQNVLKGVILVQTSLETANKKENADIRVKNLSCTGTLLVQIASVHTLWAVYWFIFCGCCGHTDIYRCMSWLCSV